MNGRAVFFAGIVVFVLCFAVWQANRLEHTLPVPSTAVATTSSTVSTSSATTTARTITGSYLGLLDAQDRLDHTYDYALIDTGPGIVRVDLRPLYGQDFIHIRKRLGLTIHTPVVATGVVKNGVFVVHTIVEASP